MLHLERRCSRVWDIPESCKDVQLLRPAFVCLLRVVWKTISLVVMMKNAHTAVHLYYYELFVRNIHL